MVRVLLVENEISVLILAESVVQGLGHTTYSAGSKTEALSLVANPGDIDVLFTDIRLPEGDLAGCELAQEARETNPDVKVLYTTGDTLTDGIKSSFVEGSQFLPKPYTVVDLVRAIKGLVAGR